MKKITQLLVLVACLLTFVSQTVLAATPPNVLYISYDDGSGWTYNHPMTKSSDGYKYTYTFSDVNKNIYFCLHTVTTGETWDEMINLQNVHYSCGTNKEEPTPEKIVNPQQLWLYGGTNHCMYYEANTEITENVTFTVDFSGENIYMSYVDVPVDEPEPQTYTVYFYDKNNSGYSTIRTYIWGNKGADSSYPGAEMTKLTNKVVKDGDNEYPVWQYTFSVTWEPTKIIINNGYEGDSNKITNGDATFVDGGFYTNGSTTGDTSVTLSDKGSSTSNTYTVYFFNTCTTSFSGVNAYVWKGSSNNGPYPGEAMVDETATNGKYVYYEDKYCPVWSFTYTADYKPDYIIFSSGDVLKTGDLSFYDNGYYNETGRNINGLELVDLPQGDVVTIYMHWKEDFIKKGNGYPRCHLYNRSSGDKYKDWDSDDQNMYLVSKKYQIWGYDVPETEIGKYDDVIFHYNFDGTEVDQYKASATTDFDADNWTRFIYTTHDGKIAYQTYLSYEEFLAEASKGYPNIYVVGGGDDQGNGMEITVGGVKQSLSWSPTQGVKIDPDTEKDPTFYLQLKPTFGNADNARFKMTWLDVAGYKAKNGRNETDDARAWATFDLGIIGVDDEMATEKWPGILDVSIDARRANFKINKAMPLLEYNQYDWAITSGNATSKDYYCVVDLHNECRSVTLIEFDPNPSVTSHVSSIETEEVTLETAKETLTATPLYAAAENGDIHMTQLNKANGSATINKADGSIVGSAGFSVKYTLVLNGTTFVADNPGTINFDYMPVAVGGRQISVRAKYFDDETEMTFHSRTGTGTISLPQATLVVPDGHNLTGTYIFQGYDDNGKQVYGVYAEGLDCELASTSSINVYSDFRFDLPASFVREGLEWYDTYGKLVPETVKTWTNWVAEDEADGTDNWSKNLMAHRTDTDRAPIFISNVATVNSIDELQDKTIEGEVYAVYPFLYDPNATFEVVETTSPGNAPARIARAASATDYEGFVVTNTYMSAHVTVDVSTSGAISGVANVEAEANNAPVEYYTISGIRVPGDPAPGLYIRRQGDKVSKVVIK